MSNLIEVANAIGEGGVKADVPFKYATICERRPTMDNPNYTTVSCVVLPIKYRTMQDIIEGLIAKDSVFSFKPDRYGMNWFDLQLCYDNCVIIIELHNCTSDVSEEWYSLLDMPAEGIEYCLTNGIAASRQYLAYKLDNREASWDDFMTARAGAQFKPFTTMPITGEMSSYEINAMIDDKFAMFD